MSARQFVGIDPGRSGGFVVLDGESRLLHSARLPWRGAGRSATLDAQVLEEWLRGRELDADPSGAWEPIVALERPAARAREETATARRVGEQVGAVVALCEVLRAPLVLIDSREWSPWALRFEAVQARSTKPKRDEDLKAKAKRLAAERKARKAAHLVVAMRRWPSLELRATDDGIADAALLAEYSRLRHLAQEGISNPQED